MLFLSGAILFLLDLASKWAACKWLKNLDSIAIAGNFFRLSYAENTGSAFSSFQGQNLKIIFITFACLLFLFHALKTSSSVREKYGYMLVISGAMGNLFDRIFRGFVVDFLDFDFFDIHISPFWIFDGYELARWPVFNFADSFICAGIIVIITVLLTEQNIER